MVDDHPIQMSIREYVDQAADQAADKAARLVMAEHLKNCPRVYLEEQVEELHNRVQKIEVRFATLVGLMIGSGCLGGAVSAGLITLAGG